MGTRGRSRSVGPVVSEPGTRGQAPAGAPVNSGADAAEAVDWGLYAGAGAGGDDVAGSAVGSVAEVAGSPEPKVVVRGRAERRKTARRAQRRRRRSLLRELPLIAVVALVVALVLKTFLVQVFVIPSGSMEQTIQIGDRVLVDKLTPWFGSQPVRGDVLVFKDPGGWLEADHKRSSDGPVLRATKKVFSYVGLLPSDDEQDLIKRVIGVPGDTVECCDDRGRLTVNGTALDEDYLAAGNMPSRQPFKVTVPAGRLWVMGDHRDVSADSRYHMANPGEGTIPMGNVVGRAFVIAWPIQRTRQLDVPASLSSLPVRAAAARGGSPVVGVPEAGAAQVGPKSLGMNPDPVEPPLVMGVLGVIPLVVRPRPVRVRREPPAG